jgi:hypothetical protein
MYPPWLLAGPLTLLLMTTALPPPAGGVAAAAELEYPRGRMNHERKIDQRPLGLWSRAVVETAVVEWTEAEAQYCSNL